jgi:hypothetical protein
MLERRRYVVRLYGNGTHVTGILEDARTGAQNTFRDADELVSLLGKAGLTSSQSVPPKGGTRTTDLRRNAPQTKRGVKKR